MRNRLTTLCSLLCLGSCVQGQSSDFLRLELKSLSSFSTLEQVDVPIQLAEDFGSTKNFNCQKTFEIVFAEPFDACNDYQEPILLSNKHLMDYIVIADRGKCAFSRKAFVLANLASINNKRISKGEDNIGGKKECDYTKGDLERDALNSRRKVPSPGAVLILNSENDLFAMKKENHEFHLNSSMSDEDADAIDIPVALAPHKLKSKLKEMKKGSKNQFEATKVEASIILGRCKNDVKSLDSKYVEDSSKWKGSRFIPKKKPKSGFLSFHSNLNFDTSAEFSTEFLVHKHQIGPIEPGNSYLVTRNVSAGDFLRAMVLKQSEVDLLKNSTVDFVEKFLAKDSSIRVLLVPFNSIVHKNDIERLMAPLPAMVSVLFIPETQDFISFSKRTVDLEGELDDRRRARDARSFQRMGGSERRNSYVRVTFDDFVSSQWDSIEAFERRSLREKKFSKNEMQKLLSMHRRSIPQVQFLRNIKEAIFTK